MAIADGNAERRNLTVLSLSIIVYFLGGAEPTGQIGLPMVNVSFNNTEVLVATVWIMLLWFHFRYWQENHVEGNDTINNRFRSVGRVSPSLISFIRKNEGLDNSPQVTVSVSELKQERSGQAGSLNWIASFTARNQNNQGGPAKTRNIKFEGWTGNLAIFKAKLAMSKIEGSTWAYWMPYLLATTAWLLGAHYAGTEVYMLYKS
jgi:hypothetical protein